jgi:hypothetical protein
MQTRRGFFGGVIATVGASALAACVDNDEWSGIVAPEPAALRPGMRYANILPRSVPVVRRASAANDTALDQSL